MVLQGIESLPIVSLTPAFQGIDNFHLNHSYKLNFIFTKLSMLKKNLCLVWNFTPSSVTMTFSFSLQAGD